MNKKFTNEDLFFTLDSCAANDIKFALLMMTGYPTETKADFQETLDFLSRCAKYHDRGMLKSIVLGTTADIPGGTPLWRAMDGMGIFHDRLGDWVHGDNDKELRIGRWFRMRRHALDLGLPILEKTADHFFEELGKIRNSKQTFGPLPSCVTKGQIENPPPRGPSA